MALNLVYGCRITIWRYLEDEERAFLGRVYPEEKFTEVKSLQLSPQKIAEFAASVGWLAPVLWFSKCTNLVKIFAKAVAFDNKNVEKFCDQQIGRGAAVDAALVEAAKQNNVGAMKDMFAAGATKRNEAMIAAASTGSINAFSFAMGGSSADVDNAVYAAAKSGQDKLLCWMLEQGLIKDPAYVMNSAIVHGQLETMRMLWRLDYPRREVNLISSAAGGNIETCEQLAEWSSTLIYFEDVLRNAARRGNIAMMHWAKEKGATDFDEAFTSAAEGKSVEALSLLLEWSANKIHMRDAMIAAAISGNVQIAQWLIKHGATKSDINDAFVRSAWNTDLRLLCELKITFGADDYDGALIGATMYHNIRGIRVIKMWGAKNPREALGFYRTHVMGRGEPMEFEKFLEKWIAECE